MAEQEERLIRIEAPILLDDSENLYDQPPFQGIIQEVQHSLIAQFSQGRSLDQDDLRYLLTKLASELVIAKTQPGGVEKFYERVLGRGGDIAATLNEFLRSPKKSLSFSKYHHPTRGAIGEFRDKLSEYPEWELYINRYKNEHSDTGQPRDRTTTGFPDRESYGTWIEGRREISAIIRRRLARVESIGEGPGRASKTWFIRPRQQPR